LNIEEIIWPWLVEKFFPIGNHGSGFVKKNFGVKHAGIGLKRGVNSTSGKTGKIYCTVPNFYTGKIFGEAVVNKLGA